MPPPELWSSNATLAALLMLCVILGQIAGRAVEGLISKRKHGAPQLDGESLRRMQEYARATHQHTTDISNLHLRTERIEVRVAELEQAQQEIERLANEIGMRLARVEERVEAMGDLVRAGQAAVTARLDAIIARFDRWGQK